MKLYQVSDRGFYGYEHPPYPAANESENKRLVQESSAIDFDTSDGFDNPGSSYLWIDESFHLNRKEVAQLVDLLNGWLEGGRLPHKTFEAE